MNRRPTLLAAAGGATFGLLGAFHGTDTVGLVRLALAGGALAAAATIDMREHRIPNRIVLPALVACALLAGPEVLRQGLVALALVAVLLVLALVQPAALGMGDIKGALLVAVALGAAATSAILLGLLFAATVGIGLTARRGRRELTTALPLAPFLAAGATIALALR